MCMYMYMLYLHVHIYMYMYIYMIKSGRPEQARQMADRCFELVGSHQRHVHVCTSCLGHTSFKYPKVTTRIVYVYSMCQLAMHTSLSACSLHLLPIQETSAVHCPWKEILPHITTDTVSHLPHSNLPPHPLSIRGESIGAEILPKQIWQCWSKRCLPCCAVLSIRRSRTPPPPVSDPPLPPASPLPPPPSPLPPPPPSLPSSFPASSLLPIVASLLEWELDLVAF